MREIASVVCKGVVGMVGTAISLRPSDFIAIITPPVEAGVWVTFMAGVSGLFLTWLMMWSLWLTIKAKQRNAQRDQEGRDQYERDERTQRESEESE